jgi:hypothetical protein
VNGTVSGRSTTTTKLLSPAHPAGGETAGQLDPSLRTSNSSGIVYGVSPGRMLGWVRIEDNMIKEIRSFYDSAVIREILTPAEQKKLDASG